MTFFKSIPVITNIYTPSSTINNIASNFASSNSTSLSKNIFPSLIQEQKIRFEQSFITPSTSEIVNETIPPSYSKTSPGVTTLILEPSSTQKLVYNYSGVSKLNIVDVERASENFSKNEPEILCVIEFFDDASVSMGCFIVFEKYYDATHYEVYKKNVFSNDDKFQRILFLDEKSLKEETDRYVKRVKDITGLNFDPSKTFIIYDPLTKEDRIYEYKMRASKVPKSHLEVDYDSILEGKELAYRRDVGVFSTSNVFSFARSNTWIFWICLDSVIDK